MPATGHRDVAPVGLCCCSLCQDARDTLEKSTGMVFTRGGASLLLGKIQGWKKANLHSGFRKSHCASSRPKNNRISEGNCLPLLHTASQEMQLLRSMSELLGFLSAEFPLILNKLGKPSAVSSSIVAAWCCSTILSPSVAAHTHVSYPPAIPQDQQGLWQCHVPQQLPSRSLRLVQEGKFPPIPSFCA